MAEHGGRVMSGGRKAVVWTLVVLASVILLVSSLVVWSKRQLLDTDAWTNSSARLLADSEVRALLSQKLVDLLYERVDVEGQLAARLPEQAKGAAPAAAAALQTAALRVTQGFLASAPAQTLWEQA